MAKKTHADIMEKLSALRPSEPTKTRGKAARKPAAEKIKVKKTAPPQKPKAAVAPKSPQPRPRTSVPSLLSSYRACPSSLSFAQFCFIKSKN